VVSTSVFLHIGGLLPYNIGMTKTPIFIRNARAASLYEYFFVSAVASVLLIRTFLAATGYPQLGSGGLHVAHMLYGGVFMVGALIICFSSLGHRAMSIASLIGGLGFGFFIDELGKFLTRDNNYFFRPASVIIYIIFVGLFFLFRKFSRERTYTPLEYTINAIALLEEVILNDLDGSEHARLQKYLERSDKNDPIVKQLRKIVQEIPKSSLVEHRKLDKMRRNVAVFSTRLLGRRDAQDIVSAIFIGQAIISLELLLFSVFGNYDLGGHVLKAIPLPQIAQLVSATISFVIVMIGAYHLRKSRLAGLEFFRRAVLVDLLVTEPFVFYSEQFLAVFGLGFKLTLWVIVLYLISAERRETLHARRR
jgi:uncharacterized membrane protein YdcZ (DUF606 family)